MAAMLIKHEFEPAFPISLAERRSLPADWCARTDGKFPQQEHYQERAVGRPAVGNHAEHSDLKCCDAAEQMQRITVRNLPTD